MVAQQEYHFNMRRSLTQMFLGAAVLISVAFAQGPPASVTSPNFGGNGNRGGGPPASVTSLGFGGNRGSGPPASVTSQGFGAGQNRFFSSGTNHQFHRNHNPQRNNFFPQNNYGAVYAVPVPYYVPLDTAEPVDDTMEQVTAPPAQYLGGPTVFDRRGTGAPAAAPLERAPREESAREEFPKDVEAPAVQSAPAKEQPETLLVFKDGRHVEVQNYAIVGDMLYDMTPGHSHKVLLADLDLDATTKQNDERGIDFRLPPHAKAR
ncbi:MAG TPA: hypothetical protein VLK33_09190 [Terriglobales bacterium]|nr:hypothetical protein [Terriglobales bacterium]